MRQCARARIAASAAPPSDVFVLDFDGVLVDSEPEVSEAGIRAAMQLWPEAFGEADGPDAAQAVVEALKPKMRAVRPVLVDGFETMAMARLLHAGCDPQRILSSWETLLPASLAEWGTSYTAIERYLETFRRDWMERQPEQYLAAHRVYAGVAAALRAADAPVYFASSKRGHRVARLATELLGVPLEEDSPRLFAALLPPNEAKPDALRQIEARPLCGSPSTTLHFVDDRLETLEAIAAADDLRRWKLYFADWGYSTEADRARARRMRGVRSIALDEFGELMKWGVVMGVDDGCEPEPEEVASAIRAEHGLGRRE